MEWALYPRNWLGALVRGALILAGAFAIFIVIQSGEHHTVPVGKFAALEMVQSLSDAKAVANSCRKGGVEKLSECKPLRGSLPNGKSGERYFFVAGNEALIGIDFSARVFVVLTPDATASTEWHCSGQPLDALPKSCSPID